MVSIAGVLANLILLAIGIVAARIMLTQGFQVGDFFGQSMNPVAILVGNVMRLNLSLFVFNLLPFPPLDGSKILSTFLPESFQPFFSMLEQYGFIILMALLYMGVISYIITPFYYALIYILLV